jgi:hypothetical protein
MLKMCVLFYIIFAGNMYTVGKEAVGRQKRYSNTYIQQDAALQSLFYLKTALHVLGGNITHHQERIQLYLQHLLFVTPLLLSAAIVEELELV